MKVNVANFRIVYMVRIFRNILNLEKIYNLLSNLNMKSKLTFIAQPDHTQSYILTMFQGQ